MQEIGGYFEFEKLRSNEYYKNLISLNTARNALVYLMEAKNIKKLYIPYYLCDVVTKILDKYNYCYEKYSIDSDFMPLLKKKMNEGEYLYIVNYYGQIGNGDILKLKSIYKNIIVDNTHGFFQKPIEYIDTIYSCRKFFGVPDGAYLATNAKKIENLKIDISKDRMNHILGRFEENASKYFSDFQKSDDKFEKEPLKLMSKVTHNILGAIDYEGILKIRNYNFDYLNSKLFKHNGLNVKKTVGAFAYPFYIEDAQRIRKNLIKKNIYIPMLWSNVTKECPKGSIEYKYSENILPIPCDQRYGKKEMDYIIKCLFNEMKESNVK